jgi:hypothetical protein
LDRSRRFDIVRKRSGYQSGHSWMGASQVLMREFVIHLSMLSKMTKLECRSTNDEIRRSSRLVTFFVIRISSFVLRHFNHSSLLLAQ